MPTAKQVVEIALAEVGYKEKASNSQLDSPTANAGSNNYTKYARDLANAGYYNGNKNGYAWCDVFVDWCFYKAFGKTEGQLIECQTGDLGAACPYSATYYKNQGRYDTTPKYGDQIFFQQGGSLVHTGIVVEVTSTTVVTVEGNSSDQVKKNTYKRTDSYIAGYGHPKYDDTTTSTTKTSTTTNSGTSSSSSSKSSSSTTSDSSRAKKYGPTSNVSMALLKDGSYGAQVKTIQRILYSAGYLDADGVDGEYGSDTKAAVKKLQTKLFPNQPSEQDGEVGSKTWTAVLTEFWE